MGLSSSKDDFCVCLERQRLPEVSLRKNSLDFDECFNWDNVLSHVDERLEVFFDRWDDPTVDSIEWDKKVQKLIETMQAQGFEFGPRKSNSRLVRAGVQNKRVLKRTDTVYEDRSVKCVKASIFHTLGEENAKDGFSREEFRAWCHEQICQKHKNLRVLFSISPWLDDLTDDLFEDADLDHNDKVNENELLVFLRRVCEITGEPTPPITEVRDVVATNALSPDEGLSYKEFRHALNEILARIFSAMFSNDMCMAAHERSAQQGSLHVPK